MIFRYCKDTSIFCWGGRSGDRMYKVLALLLFFPFVFWYSCSSSSRFRLRPFTFFSKFLYFCHLGKSKSERCETTANFTLLRDPLFWGTAHAPWQQITTEKGQRSC